METYVEIQTVYSVHATDVQWLRYRAVLLIAGQWTFRRLSGALLRYVVWYGSNVVQ